MEDERDGVPWLEALCGSVWQAALNHAGLSRDADARTHWRLWYSQQDEGRATPAPNWMQRLRETSEGMLAGWIERYAIAESGLARGLTVLADRIVGFLRQWVFERAEARQGITMQAAQ
ncbi:hypothetical protein [Teichococcus vastitatis]|uniref:Uncharacterized protein n=1 Tax=Teichococcus vastitatis TaxID=2307076 RepID=A0ABS9W8N2_9PROT|nr:hypothetical protein [Pseudoroseomonas vastitatis]MCI0755646.1 hypothetical protein [Pseudoroseomonas vastitatis]